MAKLEESWCLSDLVSPRQNRITTITPASTLKTKLLLLCKARPTAIILTGDSCVMTEFVGKRLPRAPLEPKLSSSSHLKTISKTKDWQNSLTTTLVVTQEFRWSSFLAVRLIQFSALRP